MAIMAAQLGRVAIEERQHDVVTDHGGQVEARLLHGLVQKRHGGIHRGLVCGRRERGCVDCPRSQCADEFRISWYHCRHRDRELDLRNCCASAANAKFSDQAPFAGLTTAPFLARKPFAGQEIATDNLRFAFAPAVSCGAQKEFAFAAPILALAPEKSRSPRPQSQQTRSACLLRHATAPAHSPLNPSRRRAVDCQESGAVTSG